MHAAGPYPCAAKATPYLYSVCTDFVLWVGVSQLHIEIRGAEKLSFRERQVVALKESGISASEIGLRLGVEESTVATLYRRARAKGYQVVIILDAGVLGLDDIDEPDTEE